MSETADGLTKSVNVEKIENGFIVSINKYGSVKKNGKEEYIDENKKFFSKENPLEKKEEKEDRAMSREDVFNIIDML